MNSQAKINADRAYVRSELQQRWIELLGDNAGSIPYKNWETRKEQVDVVGWPEGVPFRNYGELSAKNREQIRAVIHQIHFQRRLAPVEEVVDASTEATLL
jgi:hypothetical protein